MKCLLFVVVCSVSAAVPHFQLGSCYGYFTELSFLDYAAKLALERGFFNDILNVTNFTINISQADTLCSASTATVVTLPLLLGEGQIDGRIHRSSTAFPPAIAINGCTCSSATKIVASQVVPFKVPMISGSSTSPALSNTLEYGYFFRAVPSDNLQGKALGNFVVSVGNWTRVYGIHLSLDAFGEGLVDAFCNDVIGRGRLCEKRTMPNIVMASATLATFEANYHLVVAAANAMANESPPPRIMLVVATDISWVIYAFKLAGMLTNKHLYLASEAACTMNVLIAPSSAVTGFKAVSNNSLWNLSFWHNFPEELGCIACFLPFTDGPRATSTAFNTFWNGLTAQSLFDAGLNPAVWNSGWLNRAVLPLPYWKTHFDAMTGIIVAISSMLWQGINASDIKEDLLKAHIGTLNYEGLSGTIFFDSNGDRLMPYTVNNLRGIHNNVTNQTTYSMVVVGLYNSGSDNMNLTQDFIYRDGTTNAPADKPAPCSQGWEYSGMNRSCVQCTAGNVGLAADSVCTPCAAGTFSNTSAATECSFCQPGVSGNLTGQTACAQCTPGKATAIQGAKNCDYCLPGFFQPALGNTACDRCVVGKYSTGSGNTVCGDCLPGFVTEYPGSAQSSDCMCPVGTYRDDINATSCKSCPAETTCALGSLLSNMNLVSSSGPAPRLLSEYWSDPSDPFAIFKCEDAKHCPGGVPGVCGDSTMTGRMCAQCIKDYRVTSDGCEKCSGVETSPLLFPMIPILCGPILVWIAYNRMRDEADKWGSWKNGCAALGLLMLAHYQSIALIRETELALAERLRNFWEPFSTSNDMLSILSPECASLTDFKSGFITRCMAPLFLLIVFIEAYVLLLPLRFLNRKDLTMDFDRTFNVYCGLIYTFYIGIVKTSLELFVCVDHPNGEETLKSAPEVLCHKDEWKELVIVAVFAFTVFCLGTFCLFVYIIYIAPTQFHKSHFRRKWKFLFMKYRGKYWWWGIAWLAKGLCINVAFLASTTFGQNFIMFFAVAMYLMAAVSFKPWRHRAANLYELITTTSVMVCSYLALTNVAFPNQADETRWSAALFSLTPFVVAPFFGLGLAVKALPSIVEFERGRTAVMIKHLKHSFRLFDTADGGRCMDFLIAVTTEDRRVLLEAADIIMCEFSGEQCRAKRYTQRLIHKAEMYTTAGTKDLSLDAAFPVTKLSSALSAAGESIRSKASEAFTITSSSDTASNGKLTTTPLTIPVETNNKAEFSIDPKREAQRDEELKQSKRTAEQERELCDMVSDMLTLNVDHKPPNVLSMVDLLQTPRLTPRQTPRNGNGVVTPRIATPRGAGGVSPRSPGRQESPVTPRRSNAKC